MNKHIDPKSIEPFKVTTGPLPASTKRYSPAPGFPDVLVPYREIALHPTAKEPPIRVYDTTAETRYMVLPQRPAGTEGWSKEQLQEIVTKDCLIGVAVPQVPTV